MLHHDIPVIASNMSTASVINYHCMTKDDRVCAVQLDIYDDNNRLVKSFEEPGGQVLVLYFKKPGRYTYIFRNKDKFEKLVSSVVECHGCGKMSLKADLMEKKDIMTKIERCKKIGGLINVVKR